MKTSDLTGPALDWAVAKCEGFDPFTDGISWIIDRTGTYGQLPKYSTDWAQGGPIIEREGITTTTIHNGDLRWGAYLDDGRDFSDSLMVGPSPLIAAMRCYVASRLGDTIDIPEELTEEEA